MAVRLSTHYKSERALESAHGTVTEAEREDVASALVQAKLGGLKGTTWTFCVYCGIPTVCMWACMGDDWRGSLLKRDCWSKLPDHNPPQPPRFDLPPRVERLLRDFYQQGELTHE